MEEITVRKFLESKNMLAEQIDLNECTAAFSREMERGLAGEGSSLLMLPTYIYSGEAAATEGYAIAIDAGGTNLRTALVRFTDHGSVVEDSKTCPMPGKDGAVTKEQLFDTILDMTAPYTKMTDKVGFCFSFIMESLPGGDARVVRMCKEVDITNIEGTILGSALASAARERGMPDINVTVLNDTVAAMLGGWDDELSKAPDIGFILGTGTNCCYADGISCGGMIINMESGCFDKFPRGEAEMILDKSSAIPGDHIFEKSVGGEYLSRLVYITLILAGESKIISPRSHEAIKALKEIPGDRLDELYTDPGSFGIADGDVDAVRYIVKNAGHRAARLVCCNLTAAVKATGKGKSPQDPAVISAEGSTLWKSSLIKPELERLLREFVRGELGLHCRLIKTENGNLTGASAASKLTSYRSLPCKHESSFTS